MSIFGSDGRIDIKVDTLGFLANTLRGYEATSILREQLQNADDACAQQGVRGELRLEFLADRLTVTNPSVFTDEDWRRLTQPSSRGKFTDDEQTGEFGIGFWGSLHLTDIPVVTSGTISVSLHPVDGASSTDVVHHPGTRIDFVYRRVQTEIGARLDVGVIDAHTEAEMIAVFEQQMEQLLLFTRAIDSIALVMPDGQVLRSSRVVEPVGVNLERLVVRTEGSEQPDCDYLVVRSEIADPPPNRNGHVAIALPVSQAHRGPGLVFFTFPTETPTGLDLAVNAHFRATDDRRSLENAGEHGSWNKRIFEHAGNAVGEVLEHLLDVQTTGVEYEDAIRWFRRQPGAAAGVEERAGAFIASLDSQARRRRVVLDQNERLRLASDVVLLPQPIEPILGEYTGDTVRAGLDDSTRSTLVRWGLAKWTPGDIVIWLKGELGAGPLPRSTAPPYLQNVEHALKVLEFCEPATRLLEGTPLLLGTDDSYYPIGGRFLVRPTREMIHLLDGIKSPVVHQRFRDTEGARRAPTTDGQWLRGALIAMADQLVGKRVPQRSIGVVAKQSHIEEALEILVSSGTPLDGVPLALDENNTLTSFDNQTVFGLPAGSGRAAVAALARRLRLVPLHHSIDRPHLAKEVQSFSLSLVLEQLADAQDWDPINDAKLLVGTVAELQRERTLSESIIDRLRSASIWGANDDRAYPLTDLRLPARTYLGSISCLLLHDDLVGDREPAAPIYAALRDLLRVDVLDSTEEVVLTCEQPPSSRDERLALMEHFGDCERFSSSQTVRLKKSEFVPCVDGSLRRPSDVLLVDEELPLGLNQRRIEPNAHDRRSGAHLVALGASQLPTQEDLRKVAEETADAPVTLEREPGRMLWDFLARHHDAYAATALSALADIAWLVTNPGRVRKKPSECLDPNLSFAEILLPVPAGVPTPAADFRDKLRIRSTLDPSDVVELAEFAASTGARLGPRFFGYANSRATEGSPFAVALSPVRHLPIIPIHEVGPTAPSRLVSRKEAAIWGHLRELAPGDLLTDYPNLARAWGMSWDQDISWPDHLAVIDEIAAQSSHDSMDVGLVRERLRSLAEFELDEHQLETVRLRAVLPTSLGLQPCSAVFFGDLPPAELRHLSVHLPIVAESDDAIALIELLGLPGVSTVVELRPQFSGSVSAGGWSSALDMHSSNVLRFLKHLNSSVSASFAYSWPPDVVGVEALSVQAIRDGMVIAEWEADAHLGLDAGTRTLYVKGHHLDQHQVVDAIATAFSVERGKKSLLRNILGSSSTEAGAKELDWEGIPPLGGDDLAYYYEHATTDLDLAPDAPAEDPGSALDDAPDTSDIPHRDNPEEANEPECDNTAATVVREDFPPEESAVPPPEEAHQKSDDPAPLSHESDSQKTPGSDPGLLDRIQSVRGRTDVDELRQLGVDVVYDLSDEIEEADYEPATSEGEIDPPDETRACLSYYDVANGRLPIVAGSLRRLTSGVELESVLIFGEQISARSFGSRHVQLEDGAMLFAERQVVAGTVVRLHPSTPGSIEVVVRPDPHHVDGVWMLELDEQGRLIRLRQDDVELQWETDDAFYRAERRLEDIEALMRDGGKSAVQLIIEVFHQRPGEGLTSDEVWGLVAISRLFAKATIAAVLSQQSGLFESRDGLWFMTGDEMRMKVRARMQRRAARSSPAQPRPEEHEVLWLARRLTRLLQDASPAVALRVRDILEAPLRQVDSHD